MKRKGKLQQERPITNLPHFSDKTSKKSSRQSVIRVFFFSHSCRIMSLFCVWRHKRHCGIEKITFMSLAV